MAPAAVMEASRLVGILYPLLAYSTPCWLFGELPEALFGIAFVLVLCMAGIPLSPPPVQLRIPALIALCLTLGLCLGHSAKNWVRHFLLFARSKFIQSPEHPSACNLYLRLPRVVGNSCAEFQLQGCSVHKLLGWFICLIAMRLKSSPPVPLRCTDTCPLLANEMALDEGQLMQLAACRMVKD
jgi:hypothetical protein